MKAVVQRVLNASVSVDGTVTGRINSGLLVYLGVGHDDSEADAIWLAEKIAFLRIFNDNDGKMNLSLRDLNDLSVNAGILVISQFTLFADARKGRRPSWNGAALPETANKLYEYFINEIKKHNIECQSGVFQAHMNVSYTNDGPVTILLDTKEK